jgi:hypothetical protein
LKVYLQDFSGDTTIQDLASDNTYDFNSDPLTTESRFEIVISSSEFGPLPIALLGFTAVYEKGLVKLEWSTLSEYASSHFIVQHSTDGTLFADVDSLPAIGFSNQKHDYATIHTEPQSGANYYRLKMADRDGSVKYSPVITVILANSKENPWIEKAWYNQNTIHVELNQAVNSEINYRLVDQLGSVLYGGQLSAYSHQMKLHNVHLRPGVYWLGLQAGPMKELVPVVVME